MADDWARVREALHAADVAGSGDFGRHEATITHDSPPLLDERGAMPVLLRLLPTLNDADTVTAVAQHLRGGPWLYGHGFDALHDAFCRWAPGGVTDLGTVLGLAVGVAAAEEDADRLLDLAKQREYGANRQQVVWSLWRFAENQAVLAALRELCTDPDVAGSAMSAYRRALGLEAALELLSSLRDHPEERVRAAVRREMSKIDPEINKPGWLLEQG